MRIFCRANLYDLLGAALARPLRSDLLTTVAGLTGDDSDAMGQSRVNALSRVARQFETAEAATREFNALFIGLGPAANCCPMAVIYMTGFLNEKPLATAAQRTWRGCVLRGPRTCSSLRTI